MTYATQQDMTNRFGDREVIALTDRDRSGIIDAPVLQSALESADDEINAYLASNYSLPLANALPIVRDFACDIARYRLCGGEVVETEEVRNRYHAAIKFFEKASKGLVSLGVNALNQTPTILGSVKFTQTKRVFNASTLEDY